MCLFSWTFVEGPSQTLDRLCRRPGTAYRPTTIQTCKNAVRFLSGPAGKQDDSGDSAQLQRRGTEPTGYRRPEQVTWGQRGDKARPRPPKHWPDRPEHEPDLSRR